MARFSGGSGSGSGIPGPRGPEGPQGPAGPEGPAGEVSLEDLNTAIGDVTNYIDGFLDSSTGTTTEYIDQQDAATLLAANQYADSIVTGGSGFNFIGEYDNGADYNVGDVVTYNGGTYYRVLGPNPGYPPGTMYWTTIAEPGTDGADGTDGEGFNWRGEWSEGITPAPEVNDVFSYNNNSYILTNSFGASYAPTTGGMGWELFVSGGFNFRGEYDDNTQYSKNDVVTYYNTTYFLTASSNNGVPPFDAWGTLNESSWQVLIPTAPNFRGTYDSEDAYYAGDVVSYNGAVYILAPKGGLPVGTNWNTPDDDASNNNWDVFVPAGATGADGTGFTFRGEYDSMATYAPYNDIVSYEGTLYVSDNDNSYPMDGPFSGQDPIMAGMPSSYWEVFIPKPESFRWRGEWNASPIDGNYQIGDVVGYQGSSYLRVDDVSANSQPPFFGPGSPTPGPNMDWELMAAGGDGFNFRGTWSSMLPSWEAYVANDIVLYNGTAYIAVVRGGGTILAGSGTPGENTAGWEVFVPAAKGFVWKGSWQEPMPSMPYVEGDVVSYNSKIYVAQTPFMTQTEPGSGTPGGMGAGWSLMISSFNWRGEYDNTVTYNPYFDIVSYDGALYISDNDLGMPFMGSGSAPIDMMGNPTEYWEVFVPKAQGFVWRGSWSSVPFGGGYVAGDVVSNGGNVYLAVDNGMYPAGSGTPGQIATSNGWGLMTSGFKYRGEWTSQPNPEYINGDVVLYNGTSYVANTGMMTYILGTPGESNSGWEIIAAKGADGDPASIDTGTTTINSYSPVWSGIGLDINPTAPVPPATGSYIKIGNLIQVQIDVNFAEVLDFGSGQYSITLPFPSLYHTDVFGGSVHDVGSTTTHYSLKGHLSDNSDVATLWYISGSSQDSPFTNNAPANITTADKFHMSFSYIAALP